MMKRGHVPKKKKTTSDWKYFSSSRNRARRRQGGLAELRSYEQARDLTISLLKEWLVTFKFKSWHTYGRSIAFVLAAVLPMASFSAISTDPPGVAPHRIQN